MARVRRISVFSAFFLLLITTMSFSLKGNFSDVRFRSQSLNITISGTSTLHDWTEKSDKGRCDVVLVLDNTDKLTSLSSLNFTIPAESLKSGNNLMDNNTYKALNTGKYKNITYVLSSADVTPVNATTYQIKVLGKLTIAGTTRETDLVANAKYNPADKSYTVTGSKSMKMTDYGVKPPTVMMGTIKTGNDITINFNTKIVR